MSKRFGILAIIPSCLLTATAVFGQGQVSQPQAKAPAQPQSVAMPAADEKLKLQIDQLGRQVREQRKVVREQRSVIDRHLALEAQQAVAIADEKAVAIAQAVAISRQDDTIKTQVSNLTVMEKMLYSIIGLVLLVVLAIAAVIRGFKKRMQVTADGQSKQVSRELHIVQADRSSLVDPDAETIRNIARQFGTSEVLFTLTMPDQKKELPCRAIISQDGKPPRVFFPGTSQTEPVAWDRRRQVAKALLA